MALPLEARPIPLEEDEDGTIRIIGTRILLDMVIIAYRNGESAEEIVESCDSSGWLMFTLLPVTISTINVNWTVTCRPVKLKQTRSVTRSKHVSHLIGYDNNMTYIIIDNVENERRFHSNWCK